MNIKKLLEKPINELSSKELEAVMNYKRGEEAEARENERKEYEAKKDTDMLGLIEIAKKANDLLKSLKYSTHKVMAEQNEKLNEYGSIRGNSKGGFTLLSTNKKMKIRRRRDTTPVWDERSKKAEELLKDFLMDKVKKSNRKMFELLMGFLTKNKNGDLEYSTVMSLLSHRNLWDDSRWLEGLKLIEESYSSNLKGYQYDFELLNETTGKYEKLELNFSAID